MSRTFITKGKAVLVSGSGLRCQGSRPKEPGKVCGKLVVKPNAKGQIAGCFKCERCGQEISVESQSN